MRTRPSQSQSSCGSRSNEAPFFCKSEAVPELRVGAPISDPARCGFGSVESRRVGDRRSGSWKGRNRAITCHALLFFTLYAAFLWIATRSVLAQIQAIPPGKPPTTSADWKLDGLLTIGSNKLAVVSRVEFGTSRNYRIIPEGGRYGDFEIRAINISMGTVLLREFKAKLALPSDRNTKDAAEPVTMDFVLRLESQPPADAAPANNDSVWLDLRDIPVAVVFELYGKFSYRNVVAGQRVLGTRMTMAGHSPSRESALKLIEKELAKKRIKLQLDGEKLVVALQEKAQCPKVHVPEFGPQDDAKPVSTRPRRQSIRFHNLSLNSALEFYGILIGRPVAVGRGGPRAQITFFTSQTDLTRDETAYALTMVMALNGIGIRSAPDGSLEACAYAELAESTKP